MDVCGQSCLEFVRSGLACLVLILAREELACAAHLIFEDLGALASLRCTSSPTSASARLHLLRCLRSLRSALLNGSESH